MNPPLPPILEDQRKILSITVQNGPRYELGWNAVTRIAAYAEHGSAGYYPWFVVFVNALPIFRVNSLHVCKIEYGEGL